MKRSAGQIRKPILYLVWTVGQIWKPMLCLIRLHVIFILYLAAYPAPGLASGSHLETYPVHSLDTGSDLVAHHAHGLDTRADS